jgi:hypothetical protein
MRERNVPLPKGSKDTRASGGGKLLRQRSREGPMVVVAWESPTRFRRTLAAAPPWAFALLRFCSLSPSRLRSQNHTGGSASGSPSLRWLLIRRRGRRVLEERCEFFATLLGSEAACEHAAKKSSDETSAAPQSAAPQPAPRRPHPAAGRSPQPILRLWVVVLAAADEEFDGDFAKNRCLTEHVHQVAAVGLAHRRCSTH